MFESAQDGILLLDYETGMITDVNQFLINLLGYSKKDFLGKHIWEIGPFKDIIASKENFVTLQTEKYIRYKDMPLQTKKGHNIEVEFISNVYMVDEEPVIQCSIRDITDRINAEKTLNEINVLKDNFLMTASHELKSPLVPIKSQSEILLDGDYGNLNQNQKNAIKMIDRNEKKLERVANGIVDLSKIQSGRLSLYRRKTNISDLVAREIAEIKYRAQNNKISIINNIPSTIPNLIIDKFRIEQVVNIILDNALKFTPEKGRITVKTIKERNYVILSITDTGVGITVKNMKKLFTPFYRVDFELNRKNIGSGLGLAIAKGIVNAHGGNMWVDSKGKDKGCSFYVKLPINKLKGTESYDIII
jgi:PAS domain S-box-containing protein